MRATLPVNALSWAVMLAASAVLVLISLPALDGPLVLDSVKLHALESIVAEHGDRALLHTPAFARGFERIVSMASFLLNIQFEGALSPYQVKLTNVFIHIIASLLVFILTRMIVSATPYAPLATFVALGAGVLWLLSPLNLNVALYAVQRMTQLAALFTLAGLILYLAGRLHPKPAVGRTLITPSIVVCLPLAVLSKPNGILMIGFAFLLEIYVLQGVRPLMSARRLALVGILGAGAALVLVFWLYPGIINYQQRDFSLVERLLSQPRALVEYLVHIVLPRGGDTGVYTDDFTVSRSLFAPVTTVFALVACLVALVFCFVCRTGRAGLVAFGVAFFLVGHAVESTFIPLELYFPHRNYLPAYGIYFAVAFLGASLLPSRQWFALLLVIYAGYFTAIDYARSITWSSKQSITAAAVHYHPGSPRALADYAQVALAQGEYQQAMAANDRAIELTGALPLRIQRLFILCRAGVPLGSTEYAALSDSRTFGVTNELAQALGNLLRLYERGGCQHLQVEPLVDSLDALAQRYREQGGDPWRIQYYTDALLYAAGDRERTHQRLQGRLEADHIQSGLYRLDLLINEGNEQQAAQLMDSIRNRFEAQRLRPFESTLEALQQRLDAL